MTTSGTDIQPLIDAKRALILTLINRIADITANAKPNYDIDGQKVYWADYLKQLVDAQNKEIVALKGLIDLQNMLQPYQYISAGGGLWGGTYGSF